MASAAALGNAAVRQSVDKRIGPVTRQVTPLGLDRTGERGATINRPPRGGLRVARVCTPSHRPLSARQ